MGRKEGRHASTIIRPFFCFFFVVPEILKIHVLHFPKGCVGGAMRKTVLDRQNFVWKKWSILEGKKILSCFVVCVSFSHETAVRPSRSNHPSHTSKAKKKKKKIFTKIHN